MDSIRNKARILGRLSKRSTTANNAGSTLEDGASSVLEYPRRTKRKPRSRVVKQYEDDGAEAMYSASDDDYPFEEKVRAVIEQTRPNRKRWNSKASSTETYIVERSGPTVQATSLTHRAPIAAEDTSFFTQFRRCFLNSWTKLLLPMAPTAIAFHYGFGHNPSHSQSIVILCTSIVAVIPLSESLSFAIEELTAYVGENVGTVLSSMFQNVPQLLIGSFCLFQNQTAMAKDIIVGSLLLNLLLILGACFFFGGINRLEQFFNVTTAQRTTQILMLGVFIALFPSIFRHYVSETNGHHEISHACAVVALTSFCAFMFFELRTSRIELFPDTGATQRRKLAKGTYVQERGHKASASIIGGTAHGASFPTGAEDEDEELIPEITPPWAAFLICYSVTLLGLCSKCLVDSIPNVTDSGTFPQSFVGIVVIPLVANLPDVAYVSILVAIKDKMDLSIACIAGDCVHVVLFTLPCLAIISWIANPGQLSGNSLGLDFDEPFSVCLAISVFLVNQIIMDGKSNWLIGFFLMSAYALTAVGAWYSPQGQ